MDKLTPQQLELVEKNYMLAMWKANSWRTTNRILNVEEYEAIASLALVKASATFDPTKGVKFASYANFVMDNDIKIEVKKACNYAYKVTASAVEPDNMEIPDLEEKVDLHVSLNSLPEFSRQVLMDFYEGGYNQYEIADKYNISQTKVSLIIKKAKELITEKIKV